MFSSMWWQTQVNILILTAVLTLTSHPPPAFALPAPYGGFMNEFFDRFPHIPALSSKENELDGYLDTLQYIHEKKSVEPRERLLDDNENFDDPVQDYPQIVEDEGQPADSPERKLVDETSRNKRKVGSSSSLGDKPLLKYKYKLLVPPNQTRLSYGFRSSSKEENDSHEEDTPEAEKTTASSYSRRPTRPSKHQSSSEHKNRTNSLYGWEGQAFLPGDRSQSIPYYQSTVTMVKSTTVAPLYDRGRKPLKQISTPMPHIYQEAGDALIPRVEEDGNNTNFVVPPSGTPSPIVIYFPAPTQPYPVSPTAPPSNSQSYPEPLLGHILPLNYEAYPQEDDGAFYGPNFEYIPNVSGPVESPPDHRSFPNYQISTPPPKLLPPIIVSGKSSPSSPLPATHVRQAVLLPKEVLVPIDLPEPRFNDGIVDNRGSIDKEMPHIQHRMPMHMAREEKRYFNADLPFDKLEKTLVYRSKIKPLDDTIYYDDTLLKKIKKKPVTKKVGIIINEKGYSGDVPRPYLDSSSQLEKPDQEEPTTVGISPNEATTPPPKIVYRSKIRPLISKEKDIDINSGFMKPESKSYDSIFSGHKDIDTGLKTARNVGKNSSSSDFDSDFFSTMPYKFDEFLPMPFFHFPFPKSFSEITKDVPFFDNKDTLMKDYTVDRKSVYRKKKPTTHYKRTTSTSPSTTTSKPTTALPLSTKPTAIYFKPTRRMDIKNKMKPTTSLSKSMEEVKQYTFTFSKPETSTKRPEILSDGKEVKRGQDEDSKKKLYSTHSRSDHNLDFVEFFQSPFPNSEFNPLDFERKISGSIHGRGKSKKVLVAEGFYAKKDDHAEEVTEKPIKRKGKFKTTPKYLPKDKIIKATFFEDYYENDTEDPVRDDEMETTLTPLKHDKLSPAGKRKILEDSQPTSAESKSKVIFNGLHSNYRSRSDYLDKYKKYKQTGIDNEYSLVRFIDKVEARDSSKPRVGRLDPAFQNQEALSEIIWERSDDFLSDVPNFGGGHGSASVVSRETEQPQLNPTNPSVTSSIQIEKSGSQKNSIKMSYTLNSDEFRKKADNSNAEDSPRKSEVYLEPAISQVEKPTAMEIRVARPSLPKAESSLEPPTSVHERLERLLQSAIIKPARSLSQLVTTAASFGHGEQHSKSKTPTNKSEATHNSKEDKTEDVEADAADDIEESNETLAKVEIVNQSPHIQDDLKDRLPPEDFYGNEKLEKTVQTTPPSSQDRYKKFLRKFQTRTKSIVSSSSKLED